jgi:nickel/cobalt exporter
MPSIDTGHGVAMLELFEDCVPPRSPVWVRRGHCWPADAVHVEKTRLDDSRQMFTFLGRGGYLESAEEIAAPDMFAAWLRLSRGHAAHRYDLNFAELHHGQGLDVMDGARRDTHALAHGNDIRHRFTDRHVTTGQIVMFGLIGRLIPCPAAITRLPLCLQLKQFTLGMRLVLCFSIGLALTMVTAGVIAALRVQYISERWFGFGRLPRAHHIFRML